MLICASVWKDLFTTNIEIENDEIVNLKMIFKYIDYLLDESFL